MSRFVPLGLVASAGLLFCAACEPDCFEEYAYTNLPGRDGTATASRVSLEAVCDAHPYNCARAVDDEPYERECLVRTTGCGLVALVDTSGLARYARVYRDGELVGAAVSDDVTSEVGGCENWRHQGGAWPPILPETRELAVSEGLPIPPESAICEDAVVDQIGACRALY